MVLINIQKELGDVIRLTKVTYEDGVICCHITEELYQGYTGYPGREVLKKRLRETQSIKKNLSDREILRFITEYEKFFKTEVKSLMLSVERDIKMKLLEI